MATLGVFGSAARGDDDPGSDVDILISFPAESRYTLMTLGGVVCAIEDAVGREIDLVVDHDGLRPGFRRSVERDLIRVA